MKALYNFTLVAVKIIKVTTSYHDIKLIVDFFTRILKIHVHLTANALRKIKSVIWIKLFLLRVLKEKSLKRSVINGSHNSP